MKPIRTVISTVFTLFVSLSLQAQTPFNSPLVGGQKVILRAPDDSQTVTLSQPETPNACYEWSGPNIIEGENTPTITAKPVNDVNEYHVRRIDHCGVSEAVIKVILTDTIKLFSVHPKTCYNDGDVMKKSDFDIVTIPEGYEDLVTMKDTIASHKWLTVVGEQNVEFVLKHNWHTSTKTAVVTVVNDNLANSGAVSIPLKDLQKKLEAARDLLHELQSVTTLVNKLTPGFSCEPGFDINFDFNMPQTTCYCCNGKIVDEFNLIYPTLSGSVSYDCSFPLPYLSFPCIGGVYGVFGCAASVSVGPLNFHFRGACSQAEIPVELAGELNLGVQPQLVSKDFLSATFKAAAGAKTGIVWILGKKVEWEGLVLKLDLVFEIKALGLISSKTTYPLGVVTLFK